MFIINWIVDVVIGVMDFLFLGCPYSCSSNLQNK